MFVTYKPTELHTPFSGREGRQFWPFAEKKLFTYSFFLEIDSVDCEGCTSKRMFWADSWQDVTEIVALIRDSNIAIEKAADQKDYPYIVSIVIPSTKSPRERWEMILLSRVLQKTSAPGKGGRVYLAENDEEYVDLMLEDEGYETDAMSVIYSR